MRPGLARQKAENSWKSMYPSPSVSSSAIMRRISSGAVEPRTRRASPSSAEEIFPSSSSAPKRLKTLSISGVTSPIFLRLSLACFCWIYLGACCCSSKIREERKGN
ncbi:unnamed protein product, partial [Musa hybrid cultivar]